jgi:phosphoesterase RecJ-like protein
MRTGKTPDASVICSEFGGGGHAGAAGCTLYGEEKDVLDKVIKAIGRYL